MPAEQLAQKVMPGLDCDEPAGQKRQDGWPRVGWYRPWLQLVQLEAPLELEEPAAQMANVALVEPAGQKKPALQGASQEGAMRTVPAVP